MLNGKRVLVVGLGVSGQGAQAFLEAHGATVFGYDDQKDSTYQGQEIDLVVLSPGIPNTHPVLQMVGRAEVIGEIELGCRYLDGKAVAITGTNGKTTTTLLTAHVLNACDIPAKAVGNVGKSLCQELLERKGEVFVVELSSYQIETLESAPFQAAALLNITPDHMDRYLNFDAYAKTKIDLQKALKPGAPFFVWEGIEREIEGIRFGRMEELAGFAPHDQVNGMAAWRLCETFGVSEGEFIQAAKTFVKPAHRLELVTTLSGVKFINDSKATNPESVVEAVKGVDSGVILLAGGEEKGLSYHAWNEEFKGRVKQVFLYGKAQGKIGEQLDDCIPVTRFVTLKEAVDFAKQFAKPGQTVLLSPGCASFDQFKSYKHRGESFKQWVLEGENQNDN